MISTILGILISFAVLLDMYHRYGASTSRISGIYRTEIGNEAIMMMDHALKDETPRNWMGIIFIGVGGAFAFFLSMMRSHFIGWPFHPAGYGLAFSYAMEYFWFTTLLGWAFKRIIVRYGGIRLYRQSLPFFMGLILGDFTAASLIALLGIILRTTTYRVFIF
jgi:hypothetical protein